MRLDQAFYQIPWDELSAHVQAAAKCSPRISAPEESQAVGCSAGRVQVVGLPLSRRACQHLHHGLDVLPPLVRSHPDRCLAATCPLAPARLHTEVQMCKPAATLSGQAQAVADAVPVGWPTWDAGKPQHGRHCSATSAPAQPAARTGTRVCSILAVPASMPGSQSGQRTSEGLAATCG